MAAFRWLIVLFIALALAALPARAAEPVYPPGSRIGLVPPAGMTPSQNFFGFEDLDNSVAIVLVALPAEAYADLDKSVTADALKRQGVTLGSARSAAAAEPARPSWSIGQAGGRKGRSCANGFWWPPRRR